MAKSHGMGKMIGMAFQYGSWAIPVKTIIPNKDVFVFGHPQPSYPNHIILSPKKPIQTLKHLLASHFNIYFEQIWAAAMEVHRKHPEIYDSFTLVANGGKRQEVQQVHFHMFTNHSMVKETADETNDKNVFYRDEAICICQHPYPDWDVHFVLKPAGSSQKEYFQSILRCIDMLNNQFDIVRKGYSLVYQHGVQKQEMPVFHIVSGKKHA